MALDLSSSPFNAWIGTTSFFAKLLAPGATYPDWMPPDMSPRQLATGPISNALSNLPSLDLPSARTVVLLLAVYILLVGPVNYIVLRWRKKLHWGWVTIPLITLVFTGLSFGVGYAKRKYRSDHQQNFNHSRRSKRQRESKQLYWPVFSIQPGIQHRNF